MFLKLPDKENLLIYLLLILFAGVLAIYFFSFPYRDWILEISLLISNVLVFGYAVIRDKDLKIVYWILIAIAIIFLVHWIGLINGNIFGDFRFGPLFKIKVAGIPLVLMINWAGLIFAAITLVIRLGGYAFMAVFSSVLMVFFIFIFEPLALKSGISLRPDSLISLNLYITWFILSYILALLYKVFNLFLTDSLTRSHFIIQLLFFSVLNFYTFN